MAIFVMLSSCTELTTASSLMPSLSGSLVMVVVVSSLIISLDMYISAEPNSIITTHRNPATQGNAHPAAFAALFALAAGIAGNILKVLFILFSCH